MVAVVPQPPLLVPELVVGAAQEAAEVRAACLAAARRLAGASRQWIAVGTGPDPADGPPARVGTFRGFGVDLPVALTADGLREEGGPAPDPELPLSLLVAGWLRERVDPAVQVRPLLVPAELPTTDCIERGTRLAAELAAERGSVGLLVLGDGAITHAARAPGYLDARAGPFDERVAKALAAVDTATLLGLDVELAGQLGAVGRAPWQVLAATVSAQPAGDSGWRGELVYSAAPYGVAYHVAVWTRAAP